jgi:hypothetical protein
MRDPNPSLCIFKCKDTNVSVPGRVSEQHHTHRPEVAQSKHVSEHAHDIVHRGHVIVVQDDAPWPVASQLRIRHVTASSRRNTRTVHAKEEETVFSDG